MERQESLYTKKTGCYSWPKLNTSLLKWKKIVHWKPSGGQMEIYVSYKNTIKGVAEVKVIERSALQG